MSRGFEVPASGSLIVIGKDTKYQGPGIKVEEVENRLKRNSFLGRIQNFVELASKEAKLVHGSVGSPSVYSFSIRKIVLSPVEKDQIEGEAEEGSGPESQKKSNKNENLRLLREEFKALNEILQEATLEDLCCYKAEIRLESQKMRKLPKIGSTHSEEEKYDIWKKRDEILRKRAVFKSLIALIDSRINSRFYQEYAPEIETEIIMREFGQVDLASLEGLRVFRRFSNLINQRRKMYEKNIQSLLSSREVISEKGEEEGEEKNVSKNGTVVEIGQHYESLTYLRFCALKLGELYKKNEPQLQALLYPDPDLEVEYKIGRKLKGYPKIEIQELGNLARVVLAVSFALQLVFGHIQEFLKRDNYTPQASLEYVHYGHNLGASGLASTFKDGLVKYVIAAEEKLRQEKERLPDLVETQHGDAQPTSKLDVSPGIDDAQAVEQTNNRFNSGSNQSQYVEDDTTEHEALESGGFKDTISFFREVAGGSTDRNLRFIDSNRNSFILDLREANFSEISTDGKDLADWFGNFRKNPNATILTRIVFLRGDGKNFEVPVLIAHAGRGYPFNDLRDGNAPRIYLSSVVDRPESFAFQQVNSDKWFIPYEEFYARLVSGKTINEYLSSLGRNPTSDKMAFSPVPVLAKAIGEQERIEDLVVLITCTEEAVRGNDKGWDGVSLSLFRLVK